MLKMPAAVLTAGTLIASLLTAAPAQAIVVSLNGFLTAGSSPTTFAFSSAATPFTDGPYEIATLLFSDTLTSPSPTASASVAVASPYAFIANPEVDGNPIPGLALGSGCATILPATTCSSPDDGFSSVDFLTGPAGFAQLIVKVLVSARAEYAFSATLELVHAPELATMLVLGPALLGVAAAARRRHRR